MRVVGVESGKVFLWEIPVRILFSPKLEQNAVFAMLCNDPLVQDYRTFDRPIRKLLRPFRAP